MEEIYWAGSEASFNVYIKAIEQANEYAAKGEPSISEMLPPLYSRNGSVGVIDISGSLIPGSAGFWRLFGVLGYDDIKDALVAGVKDKDAKSLLLNINSPGGAVSGVRDAAAFIANVAQVKPLSAYTGDMMASAAMWMGAQASHITANETAIVGSIGVMRMLVDQQAALAQKGIKVTIMRAGKFKSLVNPYENLTEEGRAQVQSMLDDMYSMFVTDVANGRNTTYKNVDKNMAQGQVFLGARGKEVGLIDAVGGMTEALDYAKAESKVRSSVVFNASVTLPQDTGASIVDNAPVKPNGTDNMPKDLTKEQLAALAAGADVAAVTGEGASPATASEASGADTESNNSDNASEADAAAADNKDAGAGDDATIAKLTSDLSAAQTSVTELTAKATASEAKVAELSAQVTALQESEVGFMAIVSDIMAKRSVALNTTVTTAGLSAKDLLSAFKSQDEVFNKTFRVGGTAANTMATDKSQEKKPALVDPLFKARVVSLVQASQKSATK